MASSLSGILSGSGGRRGSKSFWATVSWALSKAWEEKGEAEQMSRAAHVRLKGGDPMLYKTYNHEHTYVSCTIPSKFRHSQVYSLSLFIDRGSGDIEAKKHTVTSFRGWRNGSEVNRLIKSLFSFSGPGFCSQHPHQKSYNCLWLQFQRIWCPLLVSAGNCTHVVHINSQRHIHVYADKCISQIISYLKIFPMWRESIGVVSL